MPAAQTAARGGAPSRRGAVAVRAAADYYSTLGVSKGSDKKEIKSAYRGLARKFHPDINKEPGAEERFKQVSEAYEVLADDEKRKLYDMYGEAGVKQGAGMGGQGAGFSNPFDIFETFFGAGMGGQGGMGGMGGMGGQGGATRQTMGEDEQLELKISFMDAVFGTSREVEVSRLSRCEACDSSGVKAGTSASTCGECQGRGQTIKIIRTPLGTFQQMATCSTCGGVGKSYVSCDSCGGDGRVRRSKRIKMTIPAGVEDGTRLRVSGEGNAGRRGGPSGDLYVYMSVAPSPDMRREGMTIYSDAEVSYVDACLGTQIKVTTVDGPVDLKIPSGTQPGTTLLLSKRGAPSPTGRAQDRGNHLVKIKVVIPKKIDADEKKLLEQLREMSTKTKIKVGPFSL